MLCEYSSTGLGQTASHKAVLTESLLQSPSPPTSHQTLYMLQVHVAMGITQAPPGT